MKDQKQLIIDDILERINASPFMLVADYTGLTVTDFGELRNRLRETGSECHVVKNAYVKRAAKAAELPEGLSEMLAGQTAIVTGEQDICAAAKVLKNFAAEFEKAAVKVGVLDGKLLDSDQVKTLASLPSREVLLAQLLGVFQAPATKLARVLNEPGSALARVLKAYGEKGAGGAGEPAPAPAAAAAVAAPAEEAPATEPTEAQAEPAEAPAEPAEAQAEPAEAQAEPAEAQAEPAETQAEPAETQAEPAASAEAEAPPAAEETPAPEAAAEPAAPEAEEAAPEQKKDEGGEPGA